MCDVFLTVYATNGLCVMTWYGEVETELFYTIYNTNNVFGGHNNTILIL